MVKTVKPNEVQLGKVSVTESVQKAMSSGGSKTKEVTAHPWWLVEDCWPSFIT